MGFNGKELEKAKEYNMNEMDWRHYDPAIARWVCTDPVIHFSTSPYSAFDNNPVYWSDPSGLDVAVYGNLTVFTGVDAAVFFTSFNKFMDNGSEENFEYQTQGDFYSEFEATGGGSVGGGDDKGKGKKKNNDFDKWGKKAKTATGMFIQCLLGEKLAGSTYNSFSNDVISESFMNSPGVEAALELYYKKYKNSTTLKNSKVTEFGAKFGVKEFFKAGFDPIEQFVGSYNVDIYFRHLCLGYEVPEENYICIVPSKILAYCKDEKYIFLKQTPYVYKDTLEVNYYIIPILHDSIDFFPEDSIIGPLKEKKFNEEILKMKIKNLKFKSLD